MYTCKMKIKIEKSKLSTVRLFGSMALVGALSVLGGGCGSGGTDDPGPCTPSGPRISVPSAFFTMPITETGAKSLREITLLNYGCSTLTFSEIAYAGDPQFKMDIPETRTLERNESITVSATFSPTQRGIAIGQLLVLSDAEELPRIEMEFIGPASDSPRPQGPDFLIFEADTKVTAATSSTNADITGFAYARYMNVGNSAVGISAFELTDDGNGTFAIQKGTAEPSATNPILVDPTGIGVVSIEYTGSGGDSGTFTITTYDARSPTTTIETHVVTISAD